MNFKEKIQVIIFLTWCTLSISAQQLVPFIGENGKYGYKNKQSIEVVSPIYDKAYPFSGGFAIVEQGTKSGLIDSTGRELTPIKYKSIYSFSEGLAVVVIEEGQTQKWGYINKEGKEVITTKYNHATEFKNGKARVMLDDKYGFL